MGDAPVTFTSQGIKPGRLVPFAGDGEWPLAHAIQHALALTDGARQQHLVVDIDQLIAA